MIRAASVKLTASESRSVGLMLSSNSRKSSSFTAMVIPNVGWISAAQPTDPRCQAHLVQHSKESLRDIWWVTAQRRITHPTFDSKIRGDRRVQGVAHVGIVGDRPHQCHAAGRLRVDAFRDQIACVHEQARGDAFVETVALEIACAMRNLHELFGRGNDLVASYIEEMPAVVKEAGEDVIKD